MKDVPVVYLKHFILVASPVNMATKKKAASKKIVQDKMQTTMEEFKHHQLKSGRSGKKVTNPKQAIAIGLSEARQAGADVPKKPKKK